MLAGDSLEKTTMARIAVGMPRKMSTTTSKYSLARDHRCQLRQEPQRGTTTSGYRSTCHSVRMADPTRCCSCSDLFSTPTRTALCVAASLAAQYQHVVMLLLPK